VSMSSQSSGLRGRIARVSVAHTQALQALEALPTAFRDGRSVDSLLSLEQQLREQAKEVGAAARADSLLSLEQQLREQAKEVGAAARANARDAAVEHYATLPLFLFFGVLDYREVLTDELDTASLCTLRVSTLLRKRIDPILASRGVVVADVAAGIHMTVLRRLVKIPKRVIWLACGEYDIVGDREDRRHSTNVDARPQHRWERPRFYATSQSGARASGRSHLHRACA